MQIQILKTKMKLLINEFKNQIFKFKFKFFFFRRKDVLKVLYNEDFFSMLRIFKSVLEDLLIGDG